jgi:diguanylate cyclase (GGDEF)-like protein
MDFEMLLLRGRFLMPDAAPGVLVLLGGALVGLLAHILHTTVGLGGSGLDGIFNDWVYNVVFLAAALACLGRGLVVDVDRGAWLAIGAGLLCWGLGDLYWTLFLADRETVSYPSPADALYLSQYVGLYLGIGLLLRARVPNLHPSQWLDGAIGALATGAVVAAILHPVIQSAGSGDTATVVTNLAYPIGDVFLIAFVVGALVLTGWTPGRAFFLIACGLTLTAIADSVFLYREATSGYTEGTWLDSLWLGGAFVVSTVAWSPRRPHLSGVAPSGLRLVAMATFFALVALGVDAFGVFAPLNPLAGGLATAALAVVIARLIITFRANDKLLNAITHDAMTDQLTQLGNRRHLVRDLSAVTDGGSDRSPYVFAIFDLDGFKNYNDTFGHLAGDRLLARLGEALGATMEGVGAAYRLGGDEFCLLSSTAQTSAGAIVARAMHALSAHGDGFDIMTSAGHVKLPEEAEDSLQALRLADQRLYRDKARRPSSANSQMRDVLIKALQEREPQLSQGIHGIGQLVVSLGRAAGLEIEDLDVAVRAAELHDIGKMAIPDEILRKRGPLTESEWDLMRQYTVIGERILGAAPALAPVGKVIRASSEHWDGSGYPDGLRGKQIPQPARVVAVCAAFHDMSCERPYRAALSDQTALDELRRGAGTQFEPRLVEDFCGWVYPTVGRPVLIRTRQGPVQPSR